MTALCVGGGTSGPKPGVAETVIYGAGAIATVMEDSGYGWAKVLAPLLGVITYDALNFCQTDPPALPTLSNAEVKAVLDLALGDVFNSGLAKLKDLVLNRLWYQLCQCSAGAQPIPAPPTGAPPTITTAVPSNTCGTLDSPVITSPPITNTFAYITIFGTTHTNPSGALANPPVTFNLPAGCTFVEITSRNLSPLAGGFLRPVQFALFFYSAANVFISGGYQGGMVAGASDVRTIAVPVNAVKYVVECIGDANDTLTRTVSASLKFLCGTSNPNAPAAPCCPENPINTAMLTQIWQQVNLIQRQAVPFGYVHGTVHAALSGAGQLAISGLLGVLVDITTLPSALGSAGTSPGEIFGGGFLTFGTPDGWPSSYRLERSHELLLPARCSAYTTFDYDLVPGLVVTVTELKREP